MFTEKVTRIFIGKCIVGALLLGGIPPGVHAQESAGNSAELSRRVNELAAMVEVLQKKVSELEGARAAISVPTPIPAAATASVAAPPPLTQIADPASKLPSGATLLGGTTVNFLFDGYYGFNFNNPIGRVNLLRPYDVSSNAFSLNQAGVIFENAPDPERGKRFGLRLDLQYGQATATLQGNAVNEPRPDIYRSIFQAYGTYVLPVGKGLTVDFGKWASSLGIEGNYSKDQINYSRSLWFEFLPFYHMGARASYKVNDSLALNYWVVNGTQWTEAFNGFKDQLFGFTLQPHKKVGWTVNYYLGQEHADVRFLPNSTDTSLPTLQGLPFQPILNPPQGKLHIFDSYATLQATPKLSFALEADYVVQRDQSYSSPSHALGGAAYMRYQLTPKLALGARTEYVSDRGGLFTGATQAIRENTVTFDHKLAEGFLMRAEWRRDSSNHPYFLTDTLGILKKEQNTVTLGLMWWFGGKQGPY